MKDCNSIQVEDSLMYIYNGQNIVDSLANKKRYIDVYDKQWFMDDPNGEIYEASEYDIDFGLFLKMKSLQVHNYQFVADNIFYDRLAWVFHITEENTKNDMYIKCFRDFFVYLIADPYGKGYTLNSSDPILNTYFTVDKQHLFVSTKYKFITELPLTTYNSIKRYDDNLELKITEIDYHRNMYILNDSKSSLVWLINNDIEYLLYLVQCFGFDKEPKINEAVLDYLSGKIGNNTDPSLYNLINFFASKDHYGNINIHIDLMQYIVDRISLNDPDPTYMTMLSKYAYDMSNIDGVHKNSSYEIYSKEERYKIATYAGYYIQKIYNNLDPNQVVPHKWDAGSFFRNEFVSNPDLLEYIKKNNYFNLPDFDNMIANILEQIKVESEEYLRTHNFDNKTMQELLS